MFMSTVNTPCNKNCADCQTICVMHPSTARLYASFGIHPAEKGAPSRLAAAMNRSAQVITNWNSRGVSIEGAVEAERQTGSPAAWILNGDKLKAPKPRNTETTSIVLACEPELPTFGAWPFASITRGQWAALSDVDRQRIEAVVLAMMAPPQGTTEKQLAA